MAEHTPTPWHFSRKFRYVSDINHKVIAEISPLVGFEANAAFIVKAVNNHASLVEALIRAREAVNAIVLSTHSVSFDADLRAIDVALAGAGITGTDLIAPRHT